MDSLHALQEEIARCRRCRGLFGFEPRPVVQGNERSKIFQLGQAPSRTVHRTGRPFDDASGKKLKGQWYGIGDEIFYDPDCFYLASMARCYPGKAKGGGDLKPPAFCADLWLPREMERVQNQLYILVGGYAAARFFPGRRMGQLAFEDLDIAGKPAFVIPHPSPLNVKWFRDHPAFEAERVPVVRAAVHRALGLASSEAGTCLTDGVGEEMHDDNGK